MSESASSPRAVVTDAETLPRSEEVLTGEALAFLGELHRRFDPRRAELLALRAERRARDRPHRRRWTSCRRPRTSARASWRVAPAPPALEDRRVEITGPTDRKMTINALNSGARIWLADFEDASAPTWENVILGQLNLIDAYERRIDFTDRGRQVLRAAPRRGTGHRRHAAARLAPRRAASAGGRRAGGRRAGRLRPVLLPQRACACSAMGKGPYFYLPKTESHLEARLWNDVFVFAQEYCGIAQGTIRATVLIETITAAFEMEEILYELRDHASGLNAGRWDYLFSIVKNFRDGGAKFVLPDRNAVTMTAPVHARVHRTAGAHLPQARRPCHRRHGRVHPLAP